MVYKQKILKMNLLIIVSSFYLMPTYAAQCVDNTQKLTKIAIQKLSDNIKYQFELSSEGSTVSSCSINDLECFEYDNEVTSCTVTVQASGESIYSEADVDSYSLKKAKYNCEYRALAFDSEVPPEENPYFFLSGGCLKTLEK